VAALGPAAPTLRHRQPGHVLGDPARGRVLILIPVRYTVRAAHPIG
jgi:hypothetical protein